MKSHPEFERLKDQWLAVESSVKLKHKPLACTVLGTEIAIVRLEGEVVAFSDRCPHRGYPLSRGKVVSDRLHCGYHGYQFDKSGGCSFNPATKSGEVCRARSYRCVEVHGVIWVSLGRPLGNPPELALSKDKSYRSISGTYELQSGLFNALENFLDATHTHYVHGNLLRFEDRRKSVQVRVKSTADSVEAIYLDEGASSGIFQRIFGVGIARSIGRYRAPNIAELDYLGPKFLRLRIVLIFTPVEVDVMRLHIIMYGRHPLARLVFALMRPFLGMLLRQDRAVLNSLPLAVRAWCASDLLGPSIAGWLKSGAIEEKEETHTLWL